MVFSKPRQQLGFFLHQIEAAGPRRCRLLQAHARFLAQVDGAVSVAKLVVTVL